MTVDSKYSWLQDAIDEDAAVVTASRRLARELRAAWDERQITAGRTAWLTPAIWFWQDWLTRLASAADDPVAMPRRLDTHSSTILLERSLKAQIPDGSLSVAGIVRQAAQAWQRLGDWQVPLSAVESSARNADERLFASAVERPLWSGIDSARGRCASGFCRTVSRR